LRDLAESCIVTDQLGGGTQCEAAALLRHATIATTKTFYARSPDEPSPDPPAPSSASTSTCSSPSASTSCGRLGRTPTPGKRRASSNATGAAVDLVQKGNGFPSRRRLLETMTPVPRGSCSPGVCGRIWRTRYVRARAGCSGPGCTASPSRRSVVARPPSASHCLRL
jgi:hypothetical protein